MFDTGELEGMRDAVADLFPDTCSVLSTPTDTSDGMGGVTRVYGGTVTVACRADFMNGSEGLIGQARQPFVGMIFSLPYDTVLANTSMIVHGGINYMVISINNDISWPIVKRVQAEKV